MRAYGLALVVVIAWGALSFGAVYPWAYLPLTFACAALGLWGLVTRLSSRDPRLMTLALLLAIVGAAMVVQTVPLPHWLVAWVSPSIDRVQQSLIFGYQPGTTQTLSMESGRTGAVIWLYLAFALLLLGATRVMRRVPMEWFVTQMMGLGVALALFGIVQMAFLDKNAPFVYGFWRPQYGATPFGPFINKNHFAGWMVMTLPLVAGYSCAVFHASARPSGVSARGWVRWLLTSDAHRLLLVASTCLVMAVSIVLTASRSGLASLAVALLTLGSVAWMRTHRPRARLVAASYLGLIVVGALLWGGADTVIARFKEAPVQVEGRLSAWRDTAHIIRDFPAFGTGLGTYGRAMLAYQTDERSTMYAQAHNDYLQLLAEGGVLVGLPVLFLVVHLARTVRLRVTSGEDDMLTSWVRLGAVAGLAGIAAQSTVEFSLQMPGNAVLFVVLLAIACQRYRRRQPHAHRV